MPLIWRFVAETGLGPVTETPPPVKNAAPVMDAAFVIGVSEAN